MKSNRFSVLTLCLAALLGAGAAEASIMRPASSMVLIQEAAQGGSLNVTNTSDVDALLYVKIYDLPDDRGPQLLVTQPVTRLAAGETQRVRFLLNTRAALTHEHLKRVIVEGIPLVPIDADRVAVNLRQDLPVIIHPAALPMLADPWKMLRCRTVNGDLRIENSGRYVVRLAQSITLLPQQKTVTLDKSYLLPGEVITLAGQGRPETRQLEIQSLSKYGYVAGKFRLIVSGAAHAQTSGRKSD
ncbi:fimbria/pilus chaperone family protein [Erwinia aphidicola]|uniref:fimbria/pilus chaperone family protein n=1 Tax=Erwinia aphidicola TaxID=68334 RepID=UPI0030CC83BD